MPRRRVIGYRLFVALCACGGLMLVPTTTLGHEEEGESSGPNQGAVSVGLGFDVGTAYFFRGIIQEDQDLIIQPWGEVGFALFEGEGFVNSLGINLGIWNSFHGGPSGTGGATTDPTSWYESDLYFGLSVGLPSNFEGSTTYTWYTSPNDSFSTVHEIAFGLSYDDSELWSAQGWEGFALNPALTLAVETQNTAFGSDEGTYLELGIEPSFTPFPNGMLQELTVAIPVTLGLSISDYYEVPGDKEDTFGYLDIGIVGSIPLPVDEDFGGWGLSAGVHFLSLGDNLDAANSGDAFEVIGMIGISMEY